MQVRSKIVVFLSILLTYSAPSITAQEPASPQLARFAVAVVKPMDPHVPHGVGIEVFPGGRTVVSGLNLKGLIEAAFDLSYWQISGGDPWVSKDIYMVEASPGEQFTITNSKHSWFHVEDEHLRQALQALLTDRFHLKFHRETRTGDVYLLERSGKRSNFADRKHSRKTVRRDLR